MPFKCILVFLLSTELWPIGMVSGACLNSGFVDDYDIDEYIVSTTPRFKRALNDLEYSNNMEPAGFFPEYLNVWDKLLPDMKTKMEIIKGNLFLPRSLENYSPETVPPSFVKSEPVDSGPGGYAKEDDEREPYQELNISPEGILTEEPVSLETETPEPYLVQGTGNQMNWKEGGGRDVEQVALNVNSDLYKLTGNVNPNFNEEVFDINELETEADSLKDGARGCYSQCLRNCYGTGSAVHGPRCGATRHAKPLIININSECLTHPSQSFSRGYGCKQKLCTNPLKFHSPPRRVHQCSSCLSDIPHFYY